MKPIEEQLREALVGLGHDKYHYNESLTKWECSPNCNKCRFEKILAAQPTGDAVSAERERCGFNFREHLAHQREWSEKTFGPGDRAKGVVEHIRKELREIESQPNDLEEWIDVVILALDGAWRSGGTPDEIIGTLVGKQAKNEKREWPDWRTFTEGQAIEHVKSATPASTPEPPAGKGDWLEHHLHVSPSPNCHLCLGKLSEAPADAPPDLEAFNVVTENLRQSRQAYMELDQKMRDAVAAERERCAKLICVNCDHGIPFSDGMNNRHRGGLYCYAWAILATPASEPAPKPQGWENHVAEKLQQDKGEK